MKTLNKLILIAFAGTFLVTATLSAAAEDATTTTNQAIAVDQNGIVKTRSGCWNGSVYHHCMQQTQVPPQCQRCGGDQACCNQCANC